MLVRICVVALLMGCSVAYVNIVSDIFSGVAGTIVPAGAEPSRGGNDGCGGVFWICAVRNDDSLGKSIEQHVRVWDFYRVDVYFVCSVVVLF